MNGDGTGGGQKQVSGHGSQPNIMACVAYAAEGEASGVFYGVLDMCRVHLARAKCDEGVFLRFRYAQAVCGFRVKHMERSEGEEMARNTLCTSDCGVLGSGDKTHYVLGSQLEVEAHFRPFVPSEPPAAAPPPQVRAADAAIGERRDLEPADHGVLRGVRADRHRLRPGRALGRMPQKHG